MSYLVLARKYRPRRFEEVVGQEPIAQTLRNAIATGRVAHAYLFAGQRGVGKTTMARILASALNCAEGPTPDPCGQCSSCEAVARGEDLDVLEIDGASNTGVDNIRELRSNARYAPARSRFKIYYVDEVHMLSKSAFNALLKTLEEPPEHVKFIFSTTEPHRIPETIHSRCQRFDFRGIPPGAVAAHLGRLIQAEGLQADEAVLTALARRSRGSLRDALSLLDQLVSATGAATDLEALDRLLGLADREQVEAMGRAVAARDPAAALRIVERLVEDGRSLGEFLSLFVEHCREALLMAACGPETDLVALPEAARRAAAELAGALGAETLLYAMHLCAETLRRLARAGDERLPVEMALVKLCTTEPIVPLADLVDRLDRLSGGVASGPGGPRVALPPSGALGAHPRAGVPQVPSQPPAGGRRGTLPGTGSDAPAPRDLRSEFSDLRGVRPQAAGLEGGGSASGVEAPLGTPPAAAGRFAPRRSTASEGDRERTAAPEPRSVEDRPRASGDAKWDAVVQAVAESRRRVAAMLREGTILSLDDDLLVLGFAPGHRAFVDHLGASEVKTLVEAAMERAFGRRIELQLAVTDPTIGSDEGGGKASVVPEAALRERAAADPAVRAVADLFRARLLEVRPVPKGQPLLEEAPPE